MKASTALGSLRWAALLLVAFAFTAQALGTAPAMYVPPAPPLTAADAAALGDAYVARTFPEFKGLYCASVVCEEPPGPGNPPTVWRLTYRLAGNPLRDIPGSIFGDWGDALVFVHTDSSVSHTIAPKRNPPRQ